MRKGEKDSGIILVGARCQILSPVSFLSLGLSRSASLAGVGMRDRGDGRGETIMVGVDDADFMSPNGVVYCLYPEGEK